MPESRPAIKGRLSTRYGAVVGFRRRKTGKNPD
jgi:hypothetical protein